MKEHVGPHYMRLDEKQLTITPGMTIRCDPKMLGNALDKFDQLDPDPPLPQPTIGLTVEKRKDTGYDVVSGATSKPINKVPLSREDAYATAGLLVPDDDKKGVEKKAGDDKSGDAPSSKKG